MTELEFDLDLELDNQDLSGFGDLSAPMTKPHVKVDTSALKEVLTACKLVSSSSGRDVISRSVMFRPEGGKLFCYATDFDCFLSVSLDLENSDNVLAETITIPIETLLKLMKAVPAKTIIYKDDEDYKICVVGGDMLLETLQVSREKFIHEEETENESTVPSTTLYAALKSLGSFVSSAATPQERRVFCTTDGIYASYLWSIIGMKRFFTPMDLQIKDIAVIRSLLSKRDEDLTFSVSKETVSTSRGCLTGSNFSYYFLISSLKMPEVMRTNAESIIDTPGMYIDLVHLFKMIDLSAELPYAINRVELSFTADSSLNLVIKTKKGADSSFVLKGSTPSQAPPPETKPLVLQAKLLRSVLRSFSSSATVYITMTDKGIGVSNSQFYAVIYQEGS